MEHNIAKYTYNQRYPG